MPRIRTIKPSLWSDPSFASMTRESRLLLIGIVSMADDDGRLVFTKSAVCGYVYPHDDIPTRSYNSWVAEVIASGIVHQYQADGFTYACIPKWHAHQVIDRYTPSTIPPPDIDCTPRSGSRKSTITRRSLDDPLDDPSPLEGKRKGRGREKEAVETPTQR